MKVIYLGAGSFWLMEAVYQKVIGVVEVVPGYMGGTISNPTEEVVATGTTGHAEVVKITYDESIVTTETLLNIFFKLHNPAAPNHPALGVGSQYRAVIFYTKEEVAIDRGNAENIGIIAQVIAGIESTLPEGVIVSTHVAGVKDFYPTEELYYNYYQTHAANDYCVTVIAPKIEAIQKQFLSAFSQ